MSGMENVTVGSSSQFVCRMESNPEGNIIWLKDGNSVATSLYSTTTVSTVKGVVTKESTLSFTNIQTSDQGSYTCQAENSVGASTQSKILNVVCKLIMVFSFGK